NHSIELVFRFFFQAEDGIRDFHVTGVKTCALPISLGDESSSEKELIERFFEGVERFTPQLVSWNGGGFDLPVLHYRALRHGVTRSEERRVGKEGGWRRRAYLR